MNRSIAAVSREIATGWVVPGVKYSTLGPSASDTPIPRPR